MANFRTASGPQSSSRSPHRSRVAGVACRIDRAADGAKWLAEPAGYLGPDAAFDRTFDRTLDRVITAAPAPLKQP
ncbi:hypothetical protein ABZW10_21275 [Kitasatospora sp. NPDC004723]|uniref:hypothetical protein n=1 Tax=Kitasatospora sp. NPDC004723 TaxID=3154288 RepID=UPI00339E21ED